MRNPPSQLWILLLMVSINMTNRMTWKSHQLVKPPLRILWINYVLYFSISAFHYMFMVNTLVKNFSNYRSDVVICTPYLCAKIHLTIIIIIYFLIHTQQYCVSHCSIQNLPLTCSFFFITDSVATVCDMCAGTHFFYFLGQVLIFISFK